MHSPGTAPRGFTLIELSIVLVVIGLIVGGVLVGQDLIRAAGVRAAISQIEKYHTAANTFRGKYGYLPGDIKDPDASTFGFAARGQYAGEGDGNEILEGVKSNAAGQNNGTVVSMGETAMFWVDLSAAKLINNSFNTATPTSQGADGCCISGAKIGDILPPAVTGGSNYIYVWSGGYHRNGANYFGLSAIKSLGANGPECSAILPVAQAYAMDSKVDDGFPQSGRAQAQLLKDPNDDDSIWANSDAAHGTWQPYTTATPGSSATCYDNGNVAGAKQQYSMSQNGGSGANCALSFKFQ